MGLYECSSRNLHFQPPPSPPGTTSITFSNPPVVHDLILCDTFSIINIAATVLANNSGFSDKEKISGSQSGRSTKVPVAPFLEQHSRKIQTLLQHLNLKSAQVNIQKKVFKKVHPWFHDSCLCSSLLFSSCLVIFSPPASPLPASDIFSYFLRLAILEKTFTAARHPHASPVNLKVTL